MIQQFVVTCTIPRTDILALLDRWVTNTLSVKTLGPQNKISPYIFVKTICAYIWSIKDLSSFFLSPAKFLSVCYDRLLFNPLKPELNPICCLLALLGVHHFLHVSRIRVKLLTFRRLMSYIYGAPILDVSRSHTTTRHSR